MPLADFIYCFANFASLAILILLWFFEIFFLSQALEVHLSILRPDQFLQIIWQDDVVLLKYLN